MHGWSNSKQDKHCKLKSDIPALNVIYQKEKPHHNITSTKTWKAFPHNSGPNIHSISHVWQLNVRCTQFRYFLH